MGISDKSYAISCIILIASMSIYYVSNIYKDKHKEYERKIAKQEEEKLSKLSLTADIGAENDLTPIAKLLLDKIDQIIHNVMSEFNNNYVAYQTITSISACADDVVRELIEYITKNEEKYRIMGCEEISNQYMLMKEIFVKNYSILYKDIYDSCKKKSSHHGLL